jgi:rod shape determining protein RodA
MKLRRLDPWLLVATLAVAVCSFLALGSTARALGVPNYATRQVVWLVAGGVLMIVFAISDYRVWARFAPLLYGGALGTLALLLFVAPARAGSHSWIGIGSFGGQPSEFARIPTILAVALVAAEHRRSRANLRLLVQLTALVAAPMLLVILQPDLGVALTYVPILLAALWLGGLPWKAWVALVLGAVVLAGSAWMWYLKPYQKERILTFLDPGRAPYGAGYQQRQSRIAVGAGGVVGRGLHAGTQSQLRFLPAQHTDFIFAVWAEETGFLGSVALILAYATLVMRVFLVALGSRDRLGAVVAGCVGTVVTTQILVNVAMVTGLAPTTGITLPLLSYGGSSVLATCIALGLVQSVWRLRYVNV